MLGAYSLLKVIESEVQAYVSALKAVWYNIYPSTASNSLNLVYSTSESNAVVLNLLRTGKGLWLQIGRCLALIQAASDVQEQGGVDDQDHFLHGVRDLLSIHSNAQAGLSTICVSSGSRCVNELCNLIQSLQKLLFASSTTAQPILTSRPLMKELDEMEKINAKLSAAVEEVTLEHRKKNEIVKHHSQEVGLQRVRELTARVRALQVS
ncbi:hypothetical protein M0R45_010192 [Rubus argutus]|uniref:Uncharacterized protein n=1 Tax=Rubus argutus TaxID=59490 RepID=A0AAW1Y716_RUBAR